MLLLVSRRRSNNEAFYARTCLAAGRLRRASGGEKSNHDCVGVRAWLCSAEIELVSR